jgi:hypothetical protein
LVSAALANIDPPRLQVIAHASSVRSNVDDAQVLPVRATNGLP